MTVEHGNGPAEQLEILKEFLAFKWGLKVLQAVGPCPGLFKKRLAFVKGFALKCYARQKANNLQTALSQLRRCPIHKRIID